MNTELPTILLIAGLSVWAAAATWAAVRRHSSAKQIQREIERDIRRALCRVHRDLDNRERVEL